jgi:hypothetical protein
MVQKVLHLVGADIDTEVDAVGLINQLNTRRRELERRTKLKLGPHPVD